MGMQALSIYLHPKTGLRLLIWDGSHPSGSGVWKKGVVFWIYSTILRMNSVYSPGGMLGS